MMSTCHTPASEIGTPPSTQDSESEARPSGTRHTGRISDAALLNAAHDCVLDLGVRRASLAEIARRAGVSRMTLYRRFPDVHSIVTALMTSEFARLLQAIRESESPGTARERLVASAVRCVRLLREHPLLNRVLETDAEILLTYVIDRLGSTQRTAENFLAHYLREGHRDGSIRCAEPAVQGRALLLAGQSFVLSHRAVAPDTDLTALDEELAHLLDATLRPDTTR